jgi:hypothetical protein
VGVTNERCRDARGASVWQLSKNRKRVKHHIGYCAGIVIRGSLSLVPVSESVKKKLTALNARFVRQSP